MIKTILLGILIFIAIPVLYLLFQVLVMAFNFVLLIGSSKKLLQDIGDRANARTPETIHLQMLERFDWVDATRVEELAGQLTRLGFIEAGTYGIQEMPAVHLRLFANQKERLGAALYERAKVHVWMDLYSGYESGEGFTVTTLQDRGLRKRPGFVTLYDPLADAPKLLEIILRERPGEGLVAITKDNIARLFEETYARQMAWRKKAGISGEEVLNVMKTMGPKDMPAEPIKPEDP